MSTATAILLGAIAASLFWAVVMLTTLMSYVSQDMDGFRRWLDRREA